MKADSSLSQLCVKEDCFLLHGPTFGALAGMPALLWSTSCSRVHSVIVPWVYKADDDEGHIDDLDTNIYIQEPAHRYGSLAAVTVPLTSYTPHLAGEDRHYLLVLRRQIWAIPGGTQRCSAPVNELFYKRTSACHWKGNILAIRVDSKQRPLELKSSDERIILSLVSQAFLKGILGRLGVPVCREDAIAMRARVDVSKAFLTTLPPELILEVLDQTPLADRLVMAKVSRQFRDKIQRIFHQRFLRLLMAFFGTHTPDVIRWMRLHSAIITGSTFHSVLHDTPPSSNIHFVVNRLEAFPFISKLNGIAGNGTGQDIAVPPNATPFMANMTIWHRIGGKSITVATSATASVLPIVLQAPSTSQMNIISSDSFFCFYPQLEFERTSFNVGGPLMSGGDNLPDLAARLALHGFKSLKSNSGWTSDCGFNCPQMRRKIRGLWGVGMFHFVRLVDAPPAHDDWRLEDGWWSLNGHCSNQFCIGRRIASGRHFIT
ncbi:hypothetical protein C8J56DRAFT_1041994 [Mycena floridula]|nr:hypothetical protein C8J56DRAFT_1041994 [Mycena floridula]